MNFRGNMRGNNAQMPARGGPLMTDHLHDLELELELLKRKRQLIQRQQSDMLYNNAPVGGMGGMSYNQQSQSFNDRFNEPQRLNFSHLYNEAPHDDRSFGTKRRAQADWPNAHVGPNPMGGNKRPRQGPQNRQNFQNKPQNFQKPRPNQPQPLLNPPMPKPLMSFPSQGRRGPQPFMRSNQGPKPLTHHPNFKQNKPGPNRPVHFTPNNKNNVSPKKQTPVKNTTPKTASDKKLARTFLPNKQPDNKMNGRLELALGMIVKEIRVTYGNKPDYKNLFTHMPLARLMKQGIRERLHAVMTGKVVHTANDILAEYRQKFPLDTDKDIVELAVVEQQKNAEKGELAIKLLEEGDPEQYFKKNMHRLLHNRFGEMMMKLEKIANSENKSITTGQILGKLPDIKKTPDDAAAEKRKTENSTAETPASAEGTPVKVAEEIDNFAEDVTVPEETKLPEETKVPEETKLPEETKVPEETKLPEETKVKTEESAKVVEDVKVDGDAGNVGAETAKDDEGTENQIDDELPADFRARRKIYDKWISLYIQRRLPALLPNYRNTILKIFDLDNMYRNTKAAIIINANNKAQALNISKSGAFSTDEQGKDDPELPRNLPYFAKVLAIPSMPKRKIMQEFLNQFQPKTIKRHKKNYNLLFVGFDSKENYDKILGANQHNVGNATVSIVGNVAKTTTIEIEDQNDNDIDQVLTPQLDDQINDLLSSIRKADEDSKEDTENVADIDLTMTSDDQENQEETKPDANGNEPQANNETTETDTSEAANEVEEPQALDGNEASQDDEECKVVEANGNNVVTIEDDEVAPLKSEEVKKPATPAKGRAPATPSTVRTRRSSRLVQN